MTTVGYISIYFDTFQSRIKPKLQEVELEIELPTSTSNYDRSKAEQIVINTDGQNKNDKPDHQHFFKG
jgi:hypothetical protein